MSNKEHLLELIQNRTELIPFIHDILAEHHLSDTSYASIFRLAFSSMAVSPEEEVAYCKGTKEWKIGKKSLSDVKLFCLLSQVCDIVRYYVLSSWDECIFSAWTSDKEVVKAEQEMNALESLSHLRGILKIASETMVYNSDGTLEWGPGEGDEES